ncbi:MAG: 3-dehydroquinate synthase [Flavobacteriales bacterium]
MPKRAKVTEVWAGDHPVYLGAGSLAMLHARLKQEGDEVRIFLLGDENTLRFCLPELLGQLGSLRNTSTIEVKSGEQTKGLETCRAVWEHLLSVEADRNAILINLGGGVVTDLGGFIAGTYKRGIRCMHVPTTLMGMCDAAIGGKSGIDLGGIKNAVGVIEQPMGVYVHVPFLRTLGKRELLNGVAEMIKHGLALDAEHWMAVRDAALHDMEALAPLILHSATLKAEVVTKDVRENGERKKLNFGHTVGHALEAHSWESGQRTLLHGEAVAFGMIAESWLSWKRKLLDRESLDAISAHILSLYKPYPLMPSDHHRLIALMRNDKKNREGSIRVTLIERIGAAVVDVEVTATQLSEAIEYYRHLVAHNALHHRS